MNILVCIKQVPASSNVEVDPVTGVMKRDGAGSKMNPYDLYALELAMSLAERYSAKVTTITMGPPQARAVIEEAVCMGAKSGVVLSDRKFAGADVLATAYTISEGIKSLEGFDLIICGKQTTDGDTAQVGAEIAEYLGIPNVSCILSVDKIENGRLYITAMLDNTVVEESVKMPCLISADADINTPRLPSYKIKQTITEDAVKFISFADLSDNDPNHYGLAGSATQVERIFPPKKNTERRNISGSKEAVSDEIFDVIRSHKLI